MSATKHCTVESEQVQASRSLPRKRIVLEYIVPAALCAILMAQMLAGVRQLSATFDEAMHLHAGWQYWKCRDFRFTPEHPPLARMVAAVPILSASLAPGSAYCGGGTRDEISRASRLLFLNDADALLFRARIASSLFAVLLCLVVWLIARHMFGWTTAVIAGVLLVFEPNVLAHGALVTNDMALTATFLLAVGAFYLWTKWRTFASLFLAGLTAGLTLVAKQSGLVVGPTLVVLALVDGFFFVDHGRVARAGRNLLAVCVIMGVAVGVIWSVYGFRFSAQPDSSIATPVIAAASAPTKDLIGHAVALVREHKLLPEAYVAGFGTAAGMTSNGRPAFLLGHLYSGGRWFYFPVAASIKLTIGVLALMLLALGGAAPLFRKYRQEALFISVPAVIFFALAMRAHLNIGFRHVLPVVPFLLIFVAAACAQLFKLRWVKYAVLTAIVAHAASSLHAYPNYLSYANELWGGPSQTYKYLTDSNVDWGQSLKQAREYLDQHPSARPCWIAAFSFDPGYYRLPCEEFGLVARRVPSQVKGTVIVSSFLLSGATRQYGYPALAPFDRAAPVDHIGGSALLVFRGDFDMRVPAGIGATLVARQAAREGKFGVALENAQAAVKLIPESGIAHAELCKGYVLNGKMPEASQECRLALRLLKSDPLYGGSDFGEMEEGIRIADSAHVP